MTPEHDLFRRVMRWIRGCGGVSRGEPASTSLDSTLATRVLALLLAFAMMVGSLPARAQNGPGPLIRDAEIEQLLRDYTQPVLRAAGLAKQNIRVVIINDRTFNAFVADGRRIFINAGALMDAKTPNEIIGVLAHESGHIAGGHLAKMRQQIENASTAALLTMLLGAGALIAGASSGSTGGANIGVAALSAPQSIIMRSLLSYQRAHEEAADRAAVKYLAATGQSPKGMYDTFKRLADQTMYQTQGADPYMQSHPMPAQRVASLEELAKSSPTWDKKDPASLQARHDLMRAKISGFLERPETVARRYPPSDTSLAARYARAIASYRFANPKAAAAQIDGLIAEQPGNPYFHELKGQALLEGGRPAEAVEPLRRAVRLAPNGALIQIMLAQALIATNGTKQADEALSLLRSAMSRESETPELYTQLAMAYSRKGDMAQADLASAQAASMRGDTITARQLAARAKTQFPVGSPSWVKADDIFSFRPGEAPRPSN